MTTLGPIAPDTAVALCTRAAQYVLDEVGTLSADDLDRPTPCAGWVVRTVVAHLSDVAAGLADLLTTGRLVLPAAPAVEAGEQVTPVRERHGRLLDELWAIVERGSSDGRQWAVTAAHAGAIEFAAHGWDVAAATGRAARMPDDLAADVLTLGAGLIGAGARGTLFGSPLTPSPDASPGEQLAAFLGRDADEWRRPVGAARWS